MYEHHTGHKAEEVESPEPEIPAYQVLCPCLYAWFAKHNSAGLEMVASLTPDDGPLKRMPEQLEILEHYHVRNTPSASIAIPKTVRHLAAR